MPRSASLTPVEPLEGRRLCAAVGVQGKFLIVTATGGVSNTITVGLSPDGASVVVTDAWVAGQGKRATPRVLAKSFPLSAGFSVVKITGGGRADLVTVDPSNGSFPIPTQIHAGAGNDTVHGGDEPDAIWGQGGNDLLVGGGGNDSLYGMTGRDTLIGGVGNDYLSGGIGKDSLEGDAGNDTLYDPYGPDTILGGDGNNLFQVHAFARDVTNDYRAATDTIKAVPVPSTSSDDDTSIGDILGGILPFL